MNNNVLEFPKSKIVRENSQHTELMELAKEKSLLKFADSIVEDLTLAMIAELDNYGIDVEDQEFIKGFSLTADALRATIYKTFDLEHPLQDFIDNNVILRKPTEEKLEE